MKKRIKGFTLVELLVVIAIFGFILAGTAQMFVTLLNSHRQQSRIAETNVEGIIGLELLRKDVEKAGYGLAWAGTFNYIEKAVNTLNLNGTTDAPRGILSVNNTHVSGVLDGTDYLVIRASSVGDSSACRRWAFILESGVSATWTSANGAAGENFTASDRVIVISPGDLDASTARTLISPGTLYSAVGSFAAPLAAPETRIIYGIDGSSNLRMPFNRADFFVRQASSPELPRRCASGTGILNKAIVNQSDGEYSYLPLLDCVADMQVVYRRDLDGDGTLDNWTDDISALTAANIRTQVKEVRIFILAHEGQRDTGYTHPVNTIPIGDAGLGRAFNLTSITGWQNYRWKVYTLVVKMHNLS